MESFVANAKAPKNENLLPQRDLGQPKEDGKQYNYVVHQGDSLTKLTYLLKCPPKQIQAMNDLVSADLIPGQKLVLPETKGYFNMLKNQKVTDKVAVEEQKIEDEKQAVFKQERLKVEQEIYDRQKKQNLTTNIDEILAANQIREELQKRESLFVKTNGEFSEDEEIVSGKKVEQPPEFCPELLDGDSDILTASMISNLISWMPSYMRNSNWRRLYQKSQDGCSLLTFYKNVREYETTVLVVKDENGYIFGGFCNETWKDSNAFYGNSQNMIFTFEKEVEPIVYKYVGSSDQHQFGSSRAIAMGGSVKTGRYALYLTNDFSTGSSNPSEMYNNDPLSAETDFFINELEVWAIDDV